MSKFYCVYMAYAKYEVVDTMNKRKKMSVDILQDISEKGF